MAAHQPPAKAVRWTAGADPRRGQPAMRPEGEPLCEHQRKDSISGAQQRGSNHGWRPISRPRRQSGGLPERTRGGASQPCGPKGSPSASTRRRTGVPTPSRGARIMDGGPSAARGGSPVDCRNGSAAGPASPQALSLEKTCRGISQIAVLQLALPHQDMMCKYQPKQFSFDIGA